MKFSPSSRSIRSGRLLVALVAALVSARATIAAQAAPASTAATSATLPSRLADADYWKLVTEMSEPGGYFRIVDNFTSNEMEVGWVFSKLQEQKVNGGVYLGVGPEQNLSYIAAIRPKMAFLFDIRRQALLQHQMFKAMFELAPDRADFLSILFAKPRPGGVDSTTEIRAMWDAFWYVPTDTALSRKNYTRIHDQLIKTHGFAMAEEMAQLRNVYDAFVNYGPVITTNGGATNGRQPANTFADMTGYSYDAAGLPKSFMSSEDNYRYLRSMHQNNLIVTVTGDFGGPKAIRAVGDYLKKNGGVVSAFYVSNVEQYLFQDGKQSQFYGNVSALPVDEKSIFIRPYSMRNFGGGGGGGGTINSLCPIAGFLRAVNGGRVYSNNDALACPLM